MMPASYRSVNSYSKVDFLLSVICFSEDTACSWYCLILFMLRSGINENATLILDKNKNMRDNKRFLIIIPNVVFPLSQNYFSGEVISD
jgi:hypothetical protein